MEAHCAFAIGIARVNKVFAASQDTYALTTRVTNRFFVLHLHLLVSCVKRFVAPSPVVFVALRRQIFRHPAKEQLVHPHWIAFTVFDYFPTAHAAFAAHMIGEHPMSKTGSLVMPYRFLKRIGFGPRHIGTSIKFLFPIGILAHLDPGPAALRLVRIRIPSALIRVLERERQRFGDRHAVDRRPAVHQRRTWPVKLAACLFRNFFFFFFLHAIDGLIVHLGRVLRCFGLRFVLRTLRGRWHVSRAFADLPDFVCHLFALSHARVPRAHAYAGFGTLAIALRGERAAHGLEFADYRSLGVGELFVFRLAAGGSAPA